MIFVFAVWALFLTTILLLVMVALLLRMAWKIYKEEMYGK